MVGNKEFVVSTQDLPDEQYIDYDKIDTKLFDFFDQREIIFKRCGVSPAAMDTWSVALLKGVLPQVTAEGVELCFLSNQNFLDHANVYLQRWEKVKENGGLKQKTKFASSSRKILRRHHKVPGLELLPK